MLCHPARASEARRVLRRACVGLPAQSQSACSALCAALMMLGNRVAGLLGFAVDVSLTVLGLRKLVECPICIEKVRPTLCGARRWQRLEASHAQVPARHCVAGVLPQGGRCLHGVCAECFTGLAEVRARLRALRKVAAADASRLAGHRSTRCRTSGESPCLALRGTASHSTRWMTW